MNVAQAKNRSIPAQRDLFFSTRALINAQSLALQAELAYAHATGTLLDSFGLQGQWIKGAASD